MSNEHQDLSIAFRALPSAPSRGSPQSSTDRNFHSLAADAPLAVCLLLSS